MTYFNEFDPGAAAWLRELMAAGEIPAGEVDERSIHDVAADDVRGRAECHYFAGIGGWPLALRLAGWPAGRPVWTGSCPCQPYSAAGKGLGDADPRDLWPEFARLIRECRPHVVFGEQVEGAIRHGWLDRVCADLEGEGYAVGAAVLGAHSVGSPHIRQRLYWVAHTEESGRRADAGSVRSGPTAGLRSPEGEDERRAGVGSGRACDSGTTRRLADADGRQSRDGGVQPGREHGQQPEDGGVGGGVGDADGSGPQPGRVATAAARHGRAALADGGAGVALGDTSGPGLEERERERGHAEPERPAAERAGVQPGYWDAYDLIPCRDGKSRRVEPGSFPLAHGIPGRVGLLRGYGNAICPQTAAAFVRAFLDCEH